MVETHIGRSARLERIDDTVDTQSASAVRTLVTGGAGFIGSELVRGLLEQGDRVRVLDDLSTGRRANLTGLEADIELVEGDLRDADVVEPATRGVETVFHQGALPSVPRSVRDPLTTSAVNVEGTLNVLAAARAAGVRRVIVASSSSVYGDTGELPRLETASPDPISPYAVSKLAAERYATSFSRVYGLDTVVLRYFNVFGPRQDPASPYAAVVPRFISAIAAGLPVDVFGDGEQSRDFTYVGDVVVANLLAAQAPPLDGAVLNVAAGRSVRVNAIADMIGEALGREVLRRTRPARPAEVRHSWADIGLARERIGYEPRVPVEEGLRLTVDALRRSNGRPPRPAAARANGRPRRLRHLVTGGAGFIGSHLAEALTGRGDRVLILDDLSTGDRRNVAHLLDRDAVELVEGSVLDPAVVDECVAAVDRVHHLASAVGVQLILAEPLDSLVSNLRGVDVVMSAAARHRRPVLFTSSSEVYGKSAAGRLRETSDGTLGAPQKARWAYAHAKAVGEALASAHFREGGLPTVVARVFNTVGPRQSGAYGMVLPRFVQQALAGEDLTVYGDGTQTRCFCHVADTVAALLALTDCAAAGGGVFNVGSSVETSVVDLARRVIERLGSASGIRFVPYDEAYGDGFEELTRRRPDTTALRDLTGWRATRTVDEAIDDMAALARGGAVAGEGAAVAG